MSELEPLRSELQAQLGSPPAGFRPEPRPRAHFGRTRPSAFMLSIGALASGACLAALWLVSRTSPPAPLAAAAVAPTTTAEDSQWLDSAVIHEPYRLPDGSTVTLAAKTLGRLETRPGQVRFELARGSAKLNVAPGNAQTWTVVVGVYQVEDVAGASFIVERAADDFTVHVEKGAARVRAAGRPEPIPLGEGQRFAATPEGYSVERSPTKPLLFERLGPTAPEASAEAAPAAVLAPPATRAGDARNADFAGLYRRGKYPEALAAAKRAGFVQLTREVDAAELGQLADAARLGGDPDSALLALQTLEHRFPRSAEASSAPFLQGRVYAARHETRPAIASFERYLRQSGRAIYANEALGRLMELYSASGETARAAELARRYLVSAPSGPYRRLALSLIAGR